MNPQPRNAIRIGWGIRSDHDTGREVGPVLHLHQIAGETPDLAILHFEEVTEHQLHQRSILALCLHQPFGDHNIAGFNKTLGEPVLMSEAFVERLWSNPEPLGAFTLDGFEEETTLYRPAT